MLIELVRRLPAQIAANLDLQAALLPGLLLCRLYQRPARAGSSGPGAENQLLHFGNFACVVQKALHMQAAKAQNFALVLAEQIADGGVLQILQIEALKICGAKGLFFQLADE